MNFDDKLAIDLGTGFILAFLLTIALVAVITPVHEGLHALGAILEGGVVKHVTWFSFTQWYHAFIYPIVNAKGEIGSTSVVFPNGPRFGGILFYFMPYIVLFPLSIIMILGSDIGISDYWRLIGGPVFIVNFQAFWTDLGLYLGDKHIVAPFPAIIWQILYLGVTVMGIVGSTIVFYLFDKRRRK